MVIKWVRVSSLGNVLKYFPITFNPLSVSDGISLCRVVSDAHARDGRVDGRVGPHGRAVGQVDALPGHRVRARHVVRRGRIHVVELHRRCEQPEQHDRQLLNTGWHRLQSPP